MNEPQHPELWEAWKRASDAFESCKCPVCVGFDDPANCEAWLALHAAKRAYIDAKEEHL